MSSTIANMPVKRSSNIELLRILAMMGIVASHYLFFVPGEVELCDTPLSYFVQMQSIWGKIGINIFMLISGYFMCTKEFSWRKYIKLWMQIIFYHVIISVIFMVSGKTPIDSVAIMDFVWPWRRLGIHYFVTAFMVFYLLTPFIKILIDNLSQKLHGYLVLILLGAFVGYATLPTFFIEMNALIWFATLFFVASYIRKYGMPYKDQSIGFWGVVNVLSIVGAMVSIYLCARFHYRWPTYYSGEANSIFAVLISVSSFMLFRNMRVPYNKWINRIAASTFGVLLIHSSCDAMRRWYMIDIFDTPHVLERSFMGGVGNIVIYVVGVFMVCSVVDMVRKQWLEDPVLKCVYKVLKIEK